MRVPVACIEIQDVGVSIVFADAALDAIRKCAIREGLPGSIVVMWKDASGRKQFISEPAQRPFFEAVRYDQLFAQVNRTMECDLKTSARSPREL